MFSKSTMKYFLAVVLFAMWQTVGPPAMAQQDDTSFFSSNFYKLCDLACKDLNAPTRHTAFYVDSYAVRALAVAYDLTGNERYLDPCKVWADRMIGFQEKMIPAGAYYMNYGRKPGEEKGEWFVADSSSIALGVLATAVRCEKPAEKERYLRSCKAFAKLVMENYIGPQGGIRNGCWSGSKDEWWCCSGIFGSLMFMLNKETGEKQYIEVGLNDIDWLNRLDMDQAGPMTFKEMGATMPMYVLEAYSAAWPSLEPNSKRQKGAIAQMKKSLDWMAEHQVGRGSSLPLDYNHQWGSKMGALPFHVLIYARSVPGNEALLTAMDPELRHITQVIDKSPKDGLSQLAAFVMISLAERVSPGTLYRCSKR